MRFSHIIRKGGNFGVIRASGGHGRHEFVMDRVERVHRLESRDLEEWHERERDLRAARSLPWSIEGEIVLDPVPVGIAPDAGVAVASRPAPRRRPAVRRQLLAAT